MSKYRIAWIAEMTMVYANGVEPLLPSDVKTWKPEHFDRARRFHEACKKSEFCRAVRCAYESAGGPYRNAHEYSTRLDVTGSHKNGILAARAFILEAITEGAR